MKQVRVRWIGSGTAIIDGEAFGRDAGDEDLLRVSYAKALAVGGKVEILPDEPKKPHRIEGPVSKPKAKKKSNAKRRRKRIIEAEPVSPPYGDVTMAEEIDERD